MLVLVLSFVAGAVLTGIFRGLLTSFIVRLIGKDRFAPVDSFEGCSSAIFSGIAYTCFSAIGMSLLARGRHPTVWIYIFPVITILLTVAYSVIWLYSAASGVRGHDFDIVEGQIKRRSDGVELHPVWAEQKVDFAQSDAFHSAVMYALVLNDEAGELARNGYTSEETYQQALTALQSTTDCILLTWRPKPKPPAESSEES